MSNRNQGKCSGWTAWHDHQPIAPPVLHVHGKCVFPTAGYTVTLRPVSPQGINPKIYILERTVQAPAGDAAQVETEVDVAYREQTNSEYSHVQIRPEDLLVEVKEVS